MMGKERMIDETMKSVFQSNIIVYVDTCMSDMAVHVVACGMREMYYSSALFVDYAS